MHVKLMTAMANSRPTLAASRLAATLLLVLAALVYVIARGQTEVHPLWGYVRAFAEAALVGGLADWFAVTALFRRPFGLPIPHTAVIPNSQGRIADALGVFIAENFLAPDLVAQRVERQDLALGLGRWLAEPANAGRIAEGVASAVPGMIDMADDQRLSALLRRAILEQLERVRLAPIAGGALQVLTAQGKHQAVIDLAIEEAYHALEENEPLLRERVKRNTSWLWRIAGLDHRASDAMIGGLEDSLREIAIDREHPVRARVAALLAWFADELKTSPSLQAQMEALKADLLAQPAVTQFLDELGGEAKAALRRAAADPAKLKAGIADAITGAGRAIAEDAAARAAINERLRALVVELAARHGADIARFVSETVRGWDARTVVEKLEQNVGADLQYIRINGTLIGGLVGLALHALSEFL